MFGVTLIVQAGLTAVSNGPEIERDSLDDGRVRIVFADTMSMSTYLVAFVVGQLELTEPSTRGRPLRVVARAGEGRTDASFALEVGAHSLNWFADYYGIPYPEAKVDHVALPDFAQGAMENVGCITYREAARCWWIPPRRRSGEQLGGRRDRRPRAGAHVVRRPGDDALVERHLAERGVRDVHGDARGRRVPARLGGLEPVLAIARARRSRSTRSQSTRPIEYQVHSPDDANGMFDTLTYLKGGAVLRMLEQYLGAERFRDGIRRYLPTHAYGNTETHDLWDALEEETGEPVRRIMDAWIWQGGYPADLVTVADDGTLRFSQRRYSPSRPDDETKWPVPLLVRQVPDGTERTDAILMEADGASLPMLAPDAVVVANAGRHQLRAGLVRRGAAGSLGGLARVDGELSPAGAVRAGRRRLGRRRGGRRHRIVVRRFVEGFRDETELPVWQPILGRARMVRPIRRR